MTTIATATRNRDKRWLLMIVIGDGHGDNNDRTAPHRTASYIHQSEPHRATPHRTALHQTPEVYKKVKFSVIV